MPVRAGRSLLLGALLLLLVGCIPKPKTAYVGLVRVEGPEAEGYLLDFDPDLPSLGAGRGKAPSQRRTSWQAHEDAIRHGEASAWQLLGLPTGGRTPPELDWSLALEDAERVRDWFRERGWSSATVTVRVQPGRLASRRAPGRYVSVHHVVTLGERTVLGSVELEGHRDLPIEVQGAVREALPRVGEPTSAATRDAAAEEMRRAMSEAGFAHARVVVQSGGPLSAREVVFRLEPGEVWTIPDVSLSLGGGLTRSSLWPAARNAFPTGRRWRLKRVRHLERQLEMRPDIADVDVVLPPADDPDAPARVRVFGGDKHERVVDFAVGGVGALLSAGARLSWFERLVGGHLVTLYGRHSAGYSLFEGPPGAFFDELQHGPLTEQVFGLDAALAPRAGLSWMLELGGVLLTHRGFVDSGGGGRTGLVWRPHPKVRVEATFDGGYRYAFGFPWQQGQFSRAFEATAPTGETFSRSYEHYSAHLVLDVDTRPNGRLSSRGVQLRLDVEPWGVADGARYERVFGSFVWHTRVARDVVVLVTTLEAGAHLRDDVDGTSSILRNRFFLGGPRSMRGFGFRRLGPPGAVGTLGEVMIGGDAMVYGSIEARVRVHPSAELIPFFDVGRVWASPGDRTDSTGGVAQQGMRFEDLQPVVGLGTRVPSPNGFLEAFMGVRLAPDHGLAGQLPRVHLLLTLYGRQRTR